MEDYGTLPRRNGASYASHAMLTLPALLLVSLVAVRALMIKGEERYHDAQVIQSAPPCACVLPPDVIDTVDDFPSETLRA